MKLRLNKMSYSERGRYLWNCDEMRLQYAQWLHQGRFYQEEERKMCILMATNHTLLLVWWRKHETKALFSTLFLHIQPTCCSLLMLVSLAL